MAGLNGGLDKAELESKAKASVVDGMAAGSVGMAKTEVLVDVGVPADSDSEAATPAPGGKAPSQTELTGARSLRVAAHGSGGSAMTEATAAGDERVAAAGGGGGHHDEGWGIAADWCRIATLPPVALAQRAHRGLSRP